MPFSHPLTEPISQDFASLNHSRKALHLLDRAQGIVEVNERDRGSRSNGSACLHSGKRCHHRTIPFVPIFLADRPFLFAIRDTESGSILFLGKFMEP